MSGWKPPRVEAAECASEPERLAVLAVEGGAVDDVVSDLWDVDDEDAGKDAIERLVRERLASIVEGYVLPKRDSPWDLVWFTLSERDDELYLERLSKRLSGGTR